MPWMHVHAHINAHTRTHVHPHTHTPILIYKHRCNRNARVHMSAIINVCVSLSVNTCMYAPLHVYMYLYGHSSIRSFPHLSCFETVRNQKTSKTINKRAASHFALNAFFKTQTRTHTYTHTDTHKSELTGDRFLHPKIFGAILHTKETKHWEKRYFISLYCCSYCCMSPQ